ncbi:hypothetical protein ACFE04_013181 [Oxalis oulophora]
MEEERSQSLLQFMDGEKLFPSPEEENKREAVINNLEQIILVWVKKVGWQRRLPKQQIAIAASSATIFTYGSFSLGVHHSQSHLHLLCVAPSFTTLNEDFFIVLRNMLLATPLISHIQCLNNPNFPLIRFNFHGFSVHLSYTKLITNNTNLLSLSQNFDTYTPLLLNQFDETSWNALSAVRANRRILQLLPNIQPIILQDGTMRPAVDDHTGKRSLMPIHIPSTTGEYCPDNITKSTFYKIRTEFLRGHNFTKDLSRADFDWSVVFEPFLYSKKYGRFVKIYLTASNPDKLQDWVGLVKSRFRSLILKLEEVQGMCDPNPTPYMDNDSSEPNVVFYWGLQPGKTNVANMESVRMDFLKNISMGYEGSLGKIELSIVPVSQLRQNGVFDTTVGSKDNKACWKILDDNQDKIPVYSKHLPSYVVGYVATVETNNPGCEEV